MPSPRLTKTRYSKTGQLYSVTTICHRREQVLSNDDAAQCVAEELQRLEADGVVENQAWVLMPDHLHWLFMLKSGTLAKCLQLLKGRSAYRINKFRQRTGPVWQPGYYDHQLRNVDSLYKHALYIIENPVRAGLSTSIEDYAHWWCVWDVVDTK